MWPHPLSPRTHTLFPYTTLFRSTPVGLALIGKADPIVIKLYSDPLQRFRLAAEGHGTVQPPEQHRERVARYFDPLPFWYPPFEGEALAEDEFPMHAITQRPAAMYHSWGSMNAWLRQTHGLHQLYISPKRAAVLGFADNDWVQDPPHHAPHQ